MDATCLEGDLASREVKRHDEELVFNRKNAYRGFKWNGFRVSLENSKSIGKLKKNLINGHWGYHGRSQGELQEDYE